MAALLLFAASISAQPRTILVLGDSLSAAYGMDIDQGWVHLLQQRLERRQLPYRVVNASISGETTSGGRSRLPRLLAQHRPAVVILELGGNDGLRGLSLPAMHSNLLEMVHMAQDAGARVVLVGMKLPPNYGPVYTRSFETVYRQVATESGVALVKFLLAGVAGNNQLMQPDGMHAAPAAQEQLLANVWPHLRPLLRQRAPADRND